MMSLRPCDLASAAVIAGAVIASSVACAEPPPWAFAVNPPGSQPPADDGVARHVPNSQAAFTPGQLQDLFNVPDWHPGDHPPMPDIVVHGRRPDVYACGFCHLPNGLGRPENASLAGLPAEYIIRQVADMKNGTRVSSEARGLPAALMVKVAKAATDEEVRTAAEYFATLPRTPWIKVIETDTVPTTRVAGWMLVAAADGGQEPIGQRIIEMPADLSRTELRDSESPFLAYVPRGSVAKGAALAFDSAGGSRTACTVCHGGDLRGLGPIPALAGRSPSYLVRQLYDFQHGARAGAWFGLMAPVVASLNEDDIIALAAYAASLPP